MKKLNFVQLEKINGGLVMNDWYCEYLNGILLSGGMVYYLPMECLF